jgi:ribosomal protein S6E (S10)
MKKLVAFVCLLAFSTLVYAQKIISDPNVELRNVGSFNSIEVSGGIDLYLSAGDEAVAVSASKPEYRDHIRTEVQSGVLKIWFDTRRGVSINGSRNLKAYVSYKKLKSLNASGGSDIAVDGMLAADELSLQVSGGSDFEGKVDASRLSVRQSGGSDVKISGKAAKLEVEASGGSDFKGFDLAADVCELSASGASDIEVTANREISAHASGASDIQYKGNPTVKEAKASGAGSVKSRS